MRPVPNWVLWATFVLVCLIFLMVLFGVPVVHVD